VTGSDKAVHVCTQRSKFHLPEDCWSPLPTNKRSADQTRQTWGTVHGGDGARWWMHRQSSEVGGDAADQGSSAHCTLHADGLGLLAFVMIFPRIPTYICTE